MAMGSDDRSRKKQSRRTQIQGLLLCVLSKARRLWRVDTRQKNFLKKFIRRVGPADVYHPEDAASGLRITGEESCASHQDIRPGTFVILLVELGGFEPPTSAVRLQRSPI